MHLAPGQFAVFFAGPSAHAELRRSHAFKDPQGEGTVTHSRGLLRVELDATL